MHVGHEKLNSLLDSHYIIIGSYYNRVNAHTLLSPQVSPLNSLIAYNTIGDNGTPY